MNSYTRHLGPLSNESCTSKKDWERIPPTKLQKIVSSIPKCLAMIQRQNSKVGVPIFCPPTINE